MATGLGVPLAELLGGTELWTDPSRCARPEGCGPTVQPWHGGHVLGQCLGILLLSWPVTIISRGILNPVQD